MCKPVDSQPHPCWACWCVFQTRESRILSELLAPTMEGTFSKHVPPLLAGVAGGSAIAPNGWRFLICADKERCVFDPYDGISGWFRRVWNDTRFREAAATRFTALRASNWSDAKVSTLINDAVQEVCHWTGWREWDGLNERGAGLRGGRVHRRGKPTPAV